MQLQHTLLPGQTLPGSRADKVKWNNENTQQTKQFTYYNLRTGSKKSPSLENSDTLDQLHLIAKVRKPQFSLPKRQN